MSHWSEAKTQFKDLATLKAAAHELGFEWNNEKSASVGYATLEGLEGSLVGKGYKHVIGVRKEKDGTFSLHTDWMFGVNTEVGSNYSRLKQTYGVRLVEAKAKQRGLSTRRVQVGGKLNLEITGIR